MRGTTWKIFLNHAQLKAQIEAPNNESPRSGTPAGRFKEICYVTCKTSERGQKSQG